jgi:large repetitive protein
VGQTSRTVTVPVKGDLVKEANETFFLNLSAAVNATISDAQGLGTITNDD